MRFKLQITLNTITANTHMQCKKAPISDKNEPGRVRDHLCQSPQAMFVTEKDVHNITSFDSQGFS